MKVEQRKWSPQGWQQLSSQGLEQSAQLVLAFGSTDVIADANRFNELKSFYPNAHIVMCSTAGHILDTHVDDDTLVASALCFEKTRLHCTSADIVSAEQSFASGSQLAGALPRDQLTHVLVFSDGLKINGSELVRGLYEGLPKGVAVTGGLVGDGARFQRTLVGLDQPPAEGKLVAIAFLSADLKIGYGSLGGWDPFGPERLVTKAKQNVLYELDGKPALQLYKEYLGEQAKDLPGSGLLFPLNVRATIDGAETEFVRTLLSVNEQEQSMTFAGDIPVGSYAKLMRANFDRLIDGASGAANLSISKHSGAQPGFALLVSCVGRKLVLKARIEEEVEAVRGVLGAGTALTGYYSYGEICPVTPLDTKCRLHNQTMTITTFTE